MNDSRRERAFRNVSDVDWLHWRDASARGAVTGVRAPAAVATGERGEAAEVNHDEERIIGVALDEA
eukprot:scaffold91265_cov65-Phaeocystis_antarctica.AAC.4